MSNGLDESVSNSEKRRGPRDCKLELTIVAALAVFSLPAALLALVCLLKKCQQRELNFSTRNI